ncbi:MAG: DUF433 domain-containing protein [Planctomycetota bacterium]|nr:DUF433 domain-containing protein [Planctomycetota bacterium]MDA1140157.1 DUF433 domain-containing protein [Planctomycetota bacterium]
MSATIASHIELNNQICGGKACIRGTRIRVQDIYVWHELQGLSPDQIVSDFPQLTLADVYAGMAYFWDNREKIREQMENAEEFVEEVKQRHPSRLQEKLAKADG